MPSSNPVNEGRPRRDGGDGLTASAVASAAAAVVARSLGGVAVGAIVGGAGFAIEQASGLLDADGWLVPALWALLPLYVLAGAAALGYAGALSGIRRAAHRLLLDSGALRRTVERGLAKARSATARGDADASDANAVGTDDEPPPRGWLGTRVAAIRLATARAVIHHLGSAAAPGADTGAQIDRIASELISDLGTTATIVAVVALAATLAAAPVLLAIG